MLLIDRIFCIIRKIDVEYSDMGIPYIRKGRAGNDKMWIVIVWVNVPKSWRLIALDRSGDHFIRKRAMVKNFFLICGFFICRNRFF